MGHIKAVLKRLQDNGLVMRFDKCTFGANKTEFWGHEISASGVRPTSSKVDAINKFPTPTTVKATQEFLGMINYYRRFIPRMADLTTPLSEILKNKPKKLTWGPDQQQAFDSIKTALSEATTLTYLDSKAPLRLTTDASKVACGAVLEQVVNGSPEPIAFFSRKLTDTERRYSTFDRELLAIYQAARHFKYILEGTPFILPSHLPIPTYTPSYFHHCFLKQHPLLFHT